MRDPGRLIGLLDLHGYPILARSEFGVFARWHRHVPDPLDRRRPMFLVAHAWYRVQTQRAPDMEGLLAAIEAALRDPPEDYPEARVRQAALHLDALRAFSLRMAERHEESLALGERVLDRLPPDATLIRGVVEFNMGAVYLRTTDMPRARTYLERAYESTLRSDVPYLILASLGHLGYVVSQTEGIAAARPRLHGAIGFAEESGRSAVPAFAIVLYQLAQVDYLADDLEAALQTLQRAEELTRDERETDIHANVLIHLARVECARGDLERAEARLTAADALAHAHQVKPFATSFEVERARLRRARGGGLPVPGSADETVDPREGWSSPAEAELVLRVQTALERGRRDETAAWAARLRERAGPGRRGVALCVAAIAEAAVATDTRRRWELFAEAMARAARCGYIRPLLEGGAPVRALIEAGLAAAALSGPERSFARDVLGRWPSGSGATPDSLDPLADLLTDKERETLALLTTGRTNQEMAGELFVSVNTVKTHLKRIYAKLDVSTRTEAADRARSLGIGSDA
ncbi:MAG: LuxR C-terminal-related transcriptional regulator [Gemmatimonadota bacterium]